MKRKFVLLTLPMIASMALITSCGSSSTIAETTTSSAPASTTSLVSASSSTPYTPFVKTPTTISLWTTTGQTNRSYLEKYISDFEKLEPNVTIDNVYQSGSYNDLKDMVEQGFNTDNYPDIVQCYPDHVAEYLDYGKAVNLDPFIDNSEYGWTDEDKADYISAFVKEGQEYTVSGTYSVPFSKSTELMYYNADVLLGLNLSSVDSTINAGKPISKAYLDSITWEELFNKLCPALVAYNNTLPDNSKIIKSDQAYHSVFAYDSDDNLFITLAQQYDYGYTSVNTTTGKGSFDFVNDGMKNLMRTFRTAADDGYIISKGSAGGNYTDTYFTAQDCLLYVGSTGGVKYVFDSSNPMNVGVARIPHAEGHDPYVINQGPSLCVLNHDDENRELASWLFYKFMTNKDNALDWALNSGYMGIRNSVYTSDAYIEANDVDNTADKSLEKLMATQNNYIPNVLDEMYTSPAFKGSSTARTEASGIMTKALTTGSGAPDISDINTWFSDAYNACLLASK